MQANNVHQLYAPRTIISNELSDVFFNMEHTAGTDIDPVYVMEENAEMLIALLESIGATNIPTIEELFDDFADRV